jgi:mono/diheme cytochrome c family protein
MDVCASCHSGAGKLLAPALSFVPGKVLDDYLYVPYVPDASVDVHGNQVQLLTSSRCFRNSAMTCITCHDVHKPQRDAAAFSQHCLTCHKAEDCGKFPTLGAKIANNCVDCHMPLQESEALVSDTNGRKIKPRVRNHRIGIYPDAALP